MLIADQTIKAKIGDGEYLGSVVKRIWDAEGRGDLYIVNLTIEGKSGFFVTRRERDIKIVERIIEDADQERGSPENQEAAKDEVVLAELAAPEGWVDHQS